MTKASMIRAFRKVLSTRPDPDATRQAQSLMDAMDLLMDLKHELKPKLQRAMAKTITQHPDGDVDSQAMRLWDAVELVAEAESDAIDIEQPPARVADDEPVGLPQSPSISPALDGKTIDLSPAPAPKSPGPVIIMPGDKEFNTSPKGPAEVKPIRFGQKPAGGKAKSGWDLSDLNRAIHERTPPNIDITVKHKGQDVVITLERNVMNAPFAMANDHDSGAVKLIYKLPQADDHLAASVTFFTSDEEINVDKAMERINEIAVQLYSPKTRHITTMVPVVKGNALTYSSENPHDGV